MAVNEGAAFESVSTWRQPEPASASSARTAVITEVAERIDRLSLLRLRVAVDGFTAAGKTSFGHELAAALRRRGRSTLRASLDDFKNPWREAREKGYDRTSGEGYYRNAYDFDSARNLLLAPAGPNGGGIVALCAHDPLTGIDHRAVTVKAPARHRVRGRGGSGCGITPRPLPRGDGDLPVRRRPEVPGRRHHRQQRLHPSPPHLASHRPSVTALDPPEPTNPTRLRAASPGAPRPW